MHAFFPNTQGIGVSKLEASRFAAAQFHAAGRASVRGVSG